MMENDELYFLHDDGFDIKVVTQVLTRIYALYLVIRLPAMSSLPSIYPIILYT